MGAWGMGSFENDDALDFVGDLAGGAGPELVLATLRRVANAEPGADVGAPDASQAVAAAEMVAAGRGHACDGFPSDAAAWLGKHTMAAAALREAALGAIARVREKSELKDLWDQADPADAKAWRAAIADLEKRLA